MKREWSAPYTSAGSKQKRFIFIMVSQTTEENLNLISEADTDRIMISADQMQKYRIPK